MATSIVFLLHLGYDIKSIEQMIQSTLESAIEQIEDKILNDPKERKRDRNTRSSHLPAGRVSQNVAQGKGREIGAAQLPSGPADDSRPRRARTLPPPQAHRRTGQASWLLNP